MATSLLLANLESVRDKWGWFLALGILLAVLGMVSLFLLPVANTVAVLALGWVLLISGVVEAVQGFKVRTWSGMFLHFSLAVLGVLVGLMVITHPFAGALVWTMLFATFFTVIGVLRVVAALRLKYARWEWSVLDGVVSFALGILLWVHWPWSGLWFMGLALGISLLLRGWSYVLMAFALRRLPPGEIEVRRAA